MSVFRIVGNFYEDILDYFTREYKKHDPAFDPYVLLDEYMKYQDNPSKSTMLTIFKTKFHGIFDLQADQVAKKTEIMQILASTYTRADRLKNSTLSYWSSRLRVFRAMTTILILLIIISFCILLYIVKLRLLKSYESTAAETAQSLLLYVICYIVFFSIILLLLIMMIEGGKMAKERRDDNDVRFKNFDIMLVPNIQVQMFFKAVGYFMQNNNLEYERIKRALERSIQDGGGEEATTEECGDNVTSKIVDAMITKNPCTNRANIAELFDVLKNDIRDFVFQFYNYGHGYVNLKKAVIKSNSAFMLKEVRKIFSFYYYLVTKRGEYDVEVSMIESNRKILDKIVLTKFEELGLTYFTTEGSEGNDEQIRELNENPSKNPSFVNRATLFVAAIKYLFIFLYPLYLKQEPDSASFKDTAISVGLPTKISPSNDFEKRTKAFFDKVSMTQYTEMKSLIMTATPQERQMLFDKYILEYQPYIERELTELLLVVKGISTFPVSTDYVKSKLREALQDKTVALADGSYREIFSTAFLDSLMPKIRNSVTDSISTIGPDKGLNAVINFKVHMLTNELANDLADYNINIIEHSDYLIEALEKDNIDPRLLEIYKKVMYGLDANIETKRRMKRMSDAIHQRFITSPEFILRLGKITYHDMFKGLDTKYTFDILNDFYNEVSNAAGGTGTNRTEQNIFYQQMRNFKLGKVLIIMLTIIIILSYVYFTIDQVVALTALSAEKTKAKQEAQGPLGRGEDLRFSIRATNIYIKILLPFVAMFFIIALLFSYHAKATHKFNFNKETIETNTSELLNAIAKLDTLIGTINKVADSNKFAAIGDIGDITEQNKTELYKNIIEVIDKYEKCNYIINVSRTRLPFPYTELTVDMFMLGVTLLTVVYFTIKISPLARLKKIQTFNKLKEQAIFMDPKEVDNLAKIEKECHAEDVDAIVFTIKVIVFSTIIMFLTFYTVTIMESAGEFRMGLYNSVYYEESRCYTGLD